MGITTSCVECKQKMVDGVLEHLKSCSGNLTYMRPDDYIRPPATVINFDTLEEREKFMAGLEASTEAENLPQLHQVSSEPLTAQPQASSSTPDNQALKARICKSCPDCVEEPCRQGTSDFCKTCTDYLALLSQEIVKARIEENQAYLDRINNYKPEPGVLTAESFGRFGAAIETTGWKHTFESRIAALQNQAEEP